MHCSVYSLTSLWLRSSHLLRTLSKKVNHAFDQDSFVRRLALARHEAHSPTEWNRGQEHLFTVQATRKEKPFLSDLGQFVLSVQPTRNQNQKMIQEATTEELKTAIQSWAILELWKKNVSPLYIPSATAESNNRFEPFFCKAGPESFCQQIRRFYRDEEFDFEDDGEEEEEGERERERESPRVRVSLMVSLMSLSVS
eukprot:TRINITY_DN3819_c0_g1_i1.p1 TRINITY_DN3819_c0_g1~~TRINITY_DN3819_c0_g1_i1.p1  ORF type:complete len:197 (-),score=36.40 TRINITY_DN3819_c0_g1_i1:88-678(-)